MAVVNKFNVNKQQVTLDADIIENMSANDVSYNDSFQYNENTVGDKLSELEKEVIYDVTSNNDGLAFASLTALLSDENLSTLIPTSVRNGGMSIRFVQSSDNKYVQYMLTAQNWSTSPLDWHNTDYLEDSFSSSELNEAVLVRQGYYINGSTGQETERHYRSCTGFINITLFSKLTFIVYGSAVVGLEGYAFYDENKDFIPESGQTFSTITKISNLSIPTNAKYFRTTWVDSGSYSSFPTYYINMYRKGIGTMLEDITDLQQDITDLQQDITDLGSVKKVIDEIIIIDSIRTYNYPRSFTENGYWSDKDNYAVLKNEYNYTSLPLISVDPGDTVVIKDFLLDKSSRILSLYGNEREKVGYVNASQIHALLDENNEIHYKIPTNVGLIGISWTSDYPANFSVIFGSDKDFFKFTPKMIEKINDVVDAPEGFGGEFSLYYQKGMMEKVTTNKAPCILCGGQSNANGALKIATTLPQSITLPINSHCRYSYTCNNNINFSSLTFKELNTQTIQEGYHSQNEPNWAFDLVVYNQICNVDNHDLYVIKHSYGGVGIDKQGATGEFCWSADYESLSEANSFIRGFEKQIRSLITNYDNDFDIKAFIWHQGEGDAKYPANERYYENLKKVIYYVRGVVGKPNLPFIFGTIPHASAQFNINVENAMKRIAAEDTNTVLIDLKNATMVDSYHFDATWAVYFGQKVYDALIDFGSITGTKIEPTEPTQS